MRPSNHHISIPSIWICPFGRRVSFWKDVWCGEEALCLVFPSIFNLVVHKDAMVVDPWDYSREEGGWSLLRICESKITL